MGEKSGAKIYSYVDDWVLLFPNLEQAPVAVRHLKKLCDALGLILSLPKSNVFADFGGDGKELTRHITIGGVRPGTSEKSDWPGCELSDGLATYITNERGEVVKSAGLVGSSTVHAVDSNIGKHRSSTEESCHLCFMDVTPGGQERTFLREVRAKCNHSVWGQRSSTTSIIYHLCSLASSMNQCFTWPSIDLQLSCDFFVRHETLVKQVWDQSINAKSYFKGKSRGCISLFQSQLNDLGWEMYAGGKCVTDQGWEFSIWEISSAQLWSWLKDPGNSRCYNIYS